jgi:hypothetical protein
MSAVSTTLWGKPYFSRRERQAVAVAGYLSRIRLANRGKDYLTVMQLQGDNWLSL